MAEKKTNVMRALDSAGIFYTAHSYPHGKDAVDGKTVAGLIGLESRRVFKTLVTRGSSRTVYVYVVPVDRELDLKKAAAVFGEKSVEMVRLEEINPLTGYIRGGCSPIGMKKQYQTVIDSSALCLESMAVSAGKIGLQVELDPRDLISVTGAVTAEIIKEH